MAQISKRRLAKEIGEKVGSLFIDSLDISNSKLDRKNLLDEILTPTEKVMLVKRVAIGVLYSAGYNYRDISDILKVSTSTARDYISLYRRNGEYTKIVDKLHRDERTKATIEKFIFTVSSVFAVGGGKSSLWKELKKKSEEESKSRF